MDALAQVRKAAAEKFYAMKQKTVSGCGDAKPATASPSKLRNESPRITGDLPEERAAIAEHKASEEFARLLEILTAPQQDIRGCQVDPTRAKLEALQQLLGWTPGGYTTRPRPEDQERKNHDRLQLLLTYRQPPAPHPDSGQPPRVCMYDHLCHTLFDVPVREVGPEVIVPELQDLEGNIVKPKWVECDWRQYESLRLPRPSMVLRANKYPYQLPESSAPKQAHEYQRRTQHWILWYFHGAHDPMPSPSDAEIDLDVRRELTKVVEGEGFHHFDYIWYHNPGLSVSDVFHVQVFWIIPWRRRQV
jgi:hypothetical protein